MTRKLVTPMKRPAPLPMDEVVRRWLVARDRIDFGGSGTAKWLTDRMNDDDDEDDGRMMVQSQPVLRHPPRRCQLILGCLSGPPYGEQTGLDY